MLAHFPLAVRRSAHTQPALSGAYHPLRMAAELPTGRVDGSLLLELLHYAGWRLRIRNADGVSIHAARDGVEVRASGPTLSETIGELFARAMRSGRAPADSPV